MLLPIRTNVRPYRTPYANYALIGVNTVIFLLTYWPHRDPLTGMGEVLKPWASHLMLTPVQPHLWQFITYAFLHGSFWHIFGNMFFLYIFGNNVNDKLGHLGYLCFYLAGAVFSGIGHTLINSNPVLGASGAVAAVTGAYLVLYPQTLITVVYWFYIVGTFELPAIYFIALKMIIIDNVIVRLTANVAYDAHLAGYAYGIIASIFLLATGFTKSSQFDLWAMLKQWNRRRQYRDVVSSGYDPYSGRRIKAEEVPKLINPEITRLREEIANFIYQKNIHEAAESYIDLITLDGGQVLPRQNLLDIANQLASEGRHDQAAMVYEKFLISYPNYEYIEQVELMLGLIYSRYLEKSDEAVKHLQIAEHKLTDPSQLKMCRDELDKLQNR